MGLWSRGSSGIRCGLGTPYHFPPPRDMFLAGLDGKGVYSSMAIIVNVIKEFMSFFAKRQKIRIVICCCARDGRRTTSIPPIRHERPALPPKP